jgi:hypothetical protein
MNSKEEEIGHSQGERKENGSSRRRMSVSHALQAGAGRRGGGRQGGEKGQRTRAQTAKGRKAFANNKKKTRKKQLAAGKQETRLATQ